MLEIKPVIKLFGLLMLVAILNSCITTKKFDLKVSIFDVVKNYSSIPREEVEIFENPEDIPVPNEKIALIAYFDFNSSDKTKWNKIIDQCASIGCNGVFRAYRRSAPVGGIVGNDVDGIAPSNKKEFIAVRYSRK